jgi:HSP20 family protein
MNDKTQLVSRDKNVMERSADGQTARRVTLTPPVDVVEDAQGITLWADLPGVTKEKLDVQVRDGHLYIDAQAAVPTPSSLRLQYEEINEPRFARVFSLSPDFDASKIEASLQDGVLKLTVPRRDEARPRRIEIMAS